MAIYFLFAFMLLTLLALTAGVTLMAIGGKWNARFSNKLMVARVAFQAVAVAFFLVVISVG